MLFDDQTDNNASFLPVQAQPLAARLRPRSFSEFIGQTHLIGANTLLRRAIDSDQFTSIIFFGPPGAGKTSLAELIAQTTRGHFEHLSAVCATVADVRRCVERAKDRLRLNNRRTILFLDEIHRFNKARQDVLLPDVENGIIRLIGATTENPFFHLIGPLLSRSQVFQLNPLSVQDIKAILLRACNDDRAFPNLQIEIDPDAVDFWARICEGDARRILTALEAAVSSKELIADSNRIRIDLKLAEESIQHKAVSYGDDGHYDTISAFIKSMRGSDPDAAIYWLAKMLQAGEDISFIARRILIFASEDIGNADPRALTIAVNTMQAVQMLGMPEARITLSQAATYCATCPKSNAAIKAIDRALTDIRTGTVQPIPLYLRDAHYHGSHQFGHGVGYQYPHDHPDHIAPQVYLTTPKSYYEPADTGYESRIRDRLRHWHEIRKKCQQTAEVSKEDQKSLRQKSI